MGRTLHGTHSVRRFPTVLVAFTVVFTVVFPPVIGCRPTARLRTVTKSTAHIVDLPEPPTPTHPLCIVSTQRRARAVTAGLTQLKM